MERPSTHHGVKKQGIRSPMPKKRSKAVPLSERVTLERVLGVSVKDDSALACNPNTGLIAYPAGCVIVIFNPRNNKQTHIFNHSKKTITALAFSGDGKNLVSGECGHNPAVRIWDVEERSQVAELQGHKFGIACVAFSPNLRYVVSIGEQHDMAVNVWNWKEGAKVFCGKISNKVTGLAFSEDGGMFVTVGNRNVKFWYLSATARRKIRETIPLNGRSGILGEQRNNFFCSVACGKGVNQMKTYCITKSGLLCEFNDSRLLDKWVELRTIGAYCLAASEEYLYVGCADGVLRVFNAATLHFVASFPKPHFLGVNVSDGTKASHMVSHQDNAKYPDTIALVHDDINKKVTCIYNDHSIYVWDVHDVKKIGKQRSFLYHSSCIWGVEVFPKMMDGHREMLPPGSFITCSSDDTIRIWNTDPAMNSDVFKRNIYSKELLKVLYVDNKYENLLDVDYNPAGTSDKTDPGEGKNGVRCLCVSPDGQYLASGDRSGNMRVHDLQFMDELYCIEAHDSEVLCLEFSKPETGFNLLASASRDRLIHVFNMEEQCSLLQTLDDHSSCITAVKFTSDNNGQVQMISCGADKSLMFRTAVQNPDFQFIRNHHVVGKQTLYDIAIDPTEKFVATACQDRNLRIHNTTTGKLKRIYKGSLSDDGTLIKVELDPSGMYAATSCSDKTLAIFDFYSGECVATMTGHSELVTGIKFTSDCKHLISVSGDGCIFLWALPWGLTHNMKERLAEMGQVKKRQEQCNMVRRGTYVVPPDLPLAIRSQSNAATTRNNNNNTEAEPEEEAEEEEVDFGEVDVVDRLQAMEQLQQLHSLEPSHNKRESVPEDYRFSMGQLPLWAKKQVSGEDIPSPTTYSSPSQPKGRWAQRVDSSGIKVKSEWENTIELRMEDCLDRRRYTVEPDALLEQDFPVTEEEFQESLEGEFVSAEEGLKIYERQLTNAQIDNLAKSCVTSTRGSDPFIPPKFASNITQDENHNPSPDEEDDDTAESNSVKEDDSKEEDIIYPPSDEALSSPDSMLYEITASTQSLEEHARRKRSREENKENGAAEKKEKKKVALESSESANKETTDPISGSTDEEEMEDDSLEEEEEAESEPISASSDNIDEEQFLHTNFSFQDKEKASGNGFVEKEKFGKCLEQLQSEFENDVSTGRLSISSKFLSRSQMSQARGPMVGIHGLAATSGGVSAEQYLLRRKQEMAMAVDKTRRRLQMLGWKVSDAGKKASGSSPEVSPRSMKKMPVISVTNGKDSVPEKVDVVAAAAGVTKSDNKDSDLDHADSLDESADSLEDIDKACTALEQENKPDGKSSVVESQKAKVDPKSASSTMSSGRKPPAVAPKPRARNRSKSSSELTLEASSSGEELSRPEEAPVSRDGDQQTKERSRKKSLPIIPVPATRESQSKSMPVIKPGQEQDDKENSKYSPASLRRGSVDCGKARMNKIKNKKERAVVMKRASSMTDIAAKIAPEESSGSPSTHVMNLRNNPRSQSSERTVIRSVPNSPAREKRRARNDTNKMTLLLPNQQQKLKSYEIGTKSSRAKVSARTDTPPSSPLRLYKKKRSLLTELKDNKSKQKENDKITAVPVDNKDSDNKNSDNIASVSPKVDAIEPNGLDSKDPDEGDDDGNGSDSPKDDCLEDDGSDCEATDTSSWGTMSSTNTGPVVEGPDQDDVNANVADLNGDSSVSVSNNMEDVEPNGKKAMDKNNIKRFSVLSNENTLDFNSSDMKVVDKDTDTSACVSSKVESVEHKSDVKDAPSVELKLDTKLAVAKSEMSSSPVSSESPLTVKMEKRSPSPKRSKSFESAEKEKRPPSPKSSIPVRVVKEEADRLAMPPPTALPVGRSKNGRKSGEDARANDKRRQSEGKGKTISNNGASPKDSPVIDQPPNWKEAQLRLSVDSSDTSGDVDSNQNGHDNTINGHANSTNGHDNAIIGHDNAINGHATTVNGQGNTVNGHHDTTDTENGGPVNGYGLDEGPPAVSRSLSSTCDSIPDDIFTSAAAASASEASASEPAEDANLPSVQIIEHDKKKMKLDLSSAPKEPTPSGDVVTPEELRAGVDQMKKAFESCISLFTKATSPDTPDISKGHHMLDYMSSTLNTMQVSVARLQSQRRRFLSTASEDSLYDSTASLASLRDRSRSSSTGFLPSMRTASRSLTPIDVDNLKMSFAKTKAPGNGKSKEEDAEAASALVLLDHYSEMLVSMVRDKIVEDLNEGSLASSRSGSVQFSSDV